MKSDLLKLLICILIIIFLYNCINSKKSKNIEGFETLSNEEIKNFKEELKILENDLIDNQIGSKIPEYILQKDIYDNENLRKFINYIVKSKYLALFLDEKDRPDSIFMKHFPKIEYYRDTYNDKTKYSLYEWILYFNLSLIFKTGLEVLFAIKDLNENKNLYKKTVDNIMSEITSETTEGEKEEVNEENVNIYLNAEIDKENNIPENYLLDVDIEELKNSINEEDTFSILSKNKFNENYENFKSRRKPTSKPSLNLSEFIKLVNNDNETKNLISKMIKNTKKITDEINNGIIGNKKIKSDEIAMIYNAVLAIYIYYSVKVKKLVKELKKIKNEYKDNLESITRTSNNTTSISSKSKGINNNVGSFIGNIFN